jgi:hypothetical protein
LTNKLMLTKFYETNGNHFIKVVFFVKSLKNTFWPSFEIVKSLTTF